MSGKPCFESFLHPEVAERLLDGQSAIVPTETVAGLVCISDRGACLNQIKQSPEDKPLTLFCSSAEEAMRLWRTEDEKLRLMTGFWPGPLTLIAGEPAVGIRVPALQPLLKLLEKTGTLASTSANLSGKPPAGCPEEVEEELLERVDFVVKSPEGFLPDNLPSTILMYQKGVFRQIRAGGITEEQWKDKT